MIDDSFIARRYLVKEMKNGLRTYGLDSCGSGWRPVAGSYDQDNKFHVL
jgi:hypothetical protein